MVSPGRVLPFRTQSTPQATGTPRPKSTSASVAQVWWGGEWDGASATASQITGRGSRACSRLLFLITEITQEGHGEEAMITGSIQHFCRLACNCTPTCQLAEEGENDSCNFRRERLVDGFQWWVHHDPLGLHSSDRDAADYIYRYQCWNFRVHCLHRMRAIDHKHGRACSVMLRFYGRVF